MTRHPAFSHALRRPARLRSDVARLAHPDRFPAARLLADAHVSSGFISVQQQLFLGRLGVRKRPFVGRFAIPGPDRAGPVTFASARDC